MKTITFDRGKFSTFMSVLSIIKTNCKDLVVRSGLIYQLGDTRKCLYDIDLSPILGKEDLILSNIESKYNLLTPFKNQQVNTIILEVDEISDRSVKYSFKDAHSKLEFQKPVESRLHNKFENKREIMEKKLSIDEDNPILTCSMKRFLLDRLYTYTKALGSETVLIFFENDKISFGVQMADDNSTNVGKILTIENVSSKIKGTASFVTSTFLLGTDEIFIDVYERKNDPDTIILRISSVVGEEGDPSSIKLIIWGHTMLKKKDE